MKPILLLDVDGVLSPFGSQDDPQGYFLLNVSDDFAYWVSHENTRRLRELGEHFELHWGTGWADPHPVMGVFHDLPPLPHVDYAASVVVVGFDTWKLPFIIDWVKDRPVAILDDEMREDAFAWADHREAPTLIVRPSAVEGMTDAHVMELITWAMALAKDSEAKE